MRLLGIISIWENTGDAWQINDYPEEDLYDFILTRAFPDDINDLNKLSSQEFKSLISDYQLFFNIIAPQIIINETTTQDEMFKILNSFYKE